MFRLIKWLVILAIIAGVVLWITGWKIRGKTIEETIRPFMQSKVVKEGIHDVRSIVGEGLKAAGEAISEDVTTDERKKLDELVKKELMEGKPVEVSPGQTALKPGPQAGTNAATKTIEHRPTVEQMQAMPKTQAPTTQQSLPATPASPSVQPKTTF